MKLVMSRAVADQIAALVAAADTEIGWWGTILPLTDKSGQLEGARLLSVIVPKQTVSAAKADVEDTGDAFSVMDELTAEGREEEIALLRYWGHSHVNMGVTPSGTDRTTWSEMSRNNPDVPSVTAFSIHNKSGASHAEIFLNVPGFGCYKWDATVVVEAAENPYLEWAKAQYEAKCTRRTLHVVTPGSSGYAYGGAYGGAYDAAIRAGRSWIPGETYREREERLAREDAAARGALILPETPGSPPKEGTSLTELAHRAVTSGASGPGPPENPVTKAADASSVVDPLGGRWKETIPPGGPLARARAEALAEDEEIERWLAQEGLGGHPEATFPGGKGASKEGGEEVPSLAELTREAAEALGGDPTESAPHIHRVGWFGRLCEERGWLGAPDSEEEDL